LSCSFSSFIFELRTRKAKNIQTSKSTNTLTTKAFVLALIDQFLMQLTCNNEKKSATNWQCFHKSLTVNKTN